MVHRNHEPEPCQGPAWSLMRLVPVSRYIRTALQGLELQVRLLGETLEQAELAAYVAGPGPSSEYVPDGLAYNPRRTKAWHLGRVKYFYEAFRDGRAVDPICVARGPAIGHFPAQGAHRVLGAHLAGIKRLAAED